MIKSPAQIRLLAMGLPDTPCNKSSKSNKTESVTNNYDNRTVTTLDAGAIAGALDLSKTAIAAVMQDKTAGYDFADGIFEGALDFANQNDARMLTAFDRAAKIQSDALEQMAGASDQVRQAYDANNGNIDGMQKIIYLAMGLAGVVALSAMKG